VCYVHFFRAIDCMKLDIHLFVVYLTILSGAQKPCHKLKALSRHLPGWTEENHRKPQGKRSLGRGLNPEPPIYENVELTTWL
jgi:hypothetical protein